MKEPGTYRQDAETEEQPLDPSSPRARILVAAVRLFTRQGYEGTSMKQLATELGMVPANLYNYFPSKQAILFEVLDSQLKALLARERQILAAARPPAETLAELARDIVVADLKDPLAAFIAHHGLNGLEGEFRERVAESMAAVRTNFLETIDAGLRQRVFEVSDSKLAAITVITMCSFVSSWYHPQGRYTIEEVADFTAAAALRCVGRLTRPPGRRPANN